MPEGPKFPKGSVPKDLSTRLGGDSEQLDVKRAQVKPPETTGRPDVDVHENFSVVLLDGPPKEFPIDRVTRWADGHEIYGTPEVLQQHGAMANAFDLVVQRMQARSGVGAGVDQDMKRMHQAGFEKALGGADHRARASELMDEVLKLLELDTK